jgi:very-short-patch-repair endonuclease
MKALLSYSHPPTRYAWALADQLNWLGWNVHLEYQVNRFSVDVWIEGTNVIAEADGSHHWDDPSQITFDQWRDSIILSKGYHIWRIPNYELFPDVNALASASALGEYCNWLWENPDSSQPDVFYTSQGWTLYGHAGYG